MASALTGLALTAGFGPGFAGCSGAPDDTAAVDSDSAADTDTAPRVDTGAYTDAAVAIDSPADGSTAYAFDPLELRWTVTGLIQDAANIGQADITDHGHSRVFLDGAIEDNTAATSFVFVGLSSGSHTLGVTLATNDGTALQASDSVTITILDPVISMSSPAEGAVLGESSTRLAFTLADFSISDDVGGAAVIGEGHAHIYVDGAYLDYTTALDDVLVPRLAEGAHTLALVLASSDHVEIGSGTTASVNVSVAAGARSILLDTTPFDAGTSTSATLPVYATVTNVDLSDGSGVNVYLDGVLVADTLTGSTTLRHIASGSHWLEVRLHDASGAETGAADYLRLTVSDEARDVTITSPAEGGEVSGDFTLQVTPTHFTFDAASMGGANLDGTGHYAVTIDGVATTTAAGDATIPALIAGDHTVQVDLLNNDGTPVSPGVSDVVHVTAI